MDVELFPATAAAIAAATTLDDTPPQWILVGSNIAANESPSRLGLKNTLKKSLNMNITATLRRYKYKTMIKPMRF